LHALQISAGKPSPTAVTCRLETAAERGQSPFGPTGAPVFACSITASGTHSAYDVQLLPNGCFVAERRKPGKAIYGCGAGKA
jgi:hypothetical protein